MKTAVIHVAVEPEMRNTLRKLAEKEGLPVSTVIRIAIRYYLDRHYNLLSRIRGGKP